LFVDTLQYRIAVAWVSATLNVSKLKKENYESL